jgi:hypothetical protein
METEGLPFGCIGLERAGHVFPTVGIIDLLMSIPAWRGWSILRGDASNNAPSASGIQGKRLVMNIHWIMNNHPLDSWRQWLVLGSSHLQSAAKISKLKVDNLTCSVFQKVQ